MAISDRKLNYYIHVAEGTCSEECQKIITQLVDEVRRYNVLQKQFAEYQKQFAATCENLVQTRREADWLAENAGECPYVSGGSTFCWRHCPMWIGPRDRSGHCEKPDMREAARRACHD